ncbi:hypothetical protein PC123_g27008 [Phytophthora cactorum]|nr:hypothetical protein PC123_g27008 [Phytophthora cactorum]
MVIWMAVMDMLLALKPGYKRTIWTLLKAACKVVCR